MALHSLAARLSKKSGVAVAFAVALSFGLFVTIYLRNPAFTGHQELLLNTDPQDLQQSSSASVNGQENLPCFNLPGAENVVVILKTGSTEFQDKFPVHINTTLKCYPNYLVFSDYEEVYEEIHIIDAVEPIAKIKGNHSDFELWHRLQEGGRAALEDDELSGTFTPSNVSMSGKTENPGWLLDKWKFFPMAVRTLREYPQKEWVRC